MIYIKEHPAQTSFGREENFYQELLQIPRVRIINMNVSSYELMKNCLAVSSITGTVGWECQFFGKPFIMFGTYLTECLEGAYRVRTNEECKKVLDKILAGDYYVMSDKELKLFMKAMDMHSYEYETSGDIMWPYVKEVMDLEDPV